VGAAVGGDASGWRVATALFPVNPPPPFFPPISLCDGSIGIVDDSIREGRTFIYLFILFYCSIIRAPMCLLVPCVMDR
jgi:hypothetical protein